MNLYMIYFLGAFHWNENLSASDWPPALSGRLVVGTVPARVPPAYSFERAPPIGSVGQRPHPASTLPTLPSSYYITLGYPPWPSNSKTCFRSKVGEAAIENRLTVEFEKKIRKRMANEASQKWSRICVEPLPANPEYDGLLTNEQNCRRSRTCQSFNNQQSKSYICSSL